MLLRGRYPALYTFKREHYHLLYKHSLSRMSPFVIPDDVFAVKMTRHETTLAIEPTPTAILEVYSRPKRDLQVFESAVPSCSDVVAVTSSSWLVFVNEVSLEKIPPELLFFASCKSMTP